jgi:hypothetical protein
MEVNKETSPKLHDALVAWVRKRGDDAVSVSAIEDDSYVSNTGCDTCGYGSEAVLSFRVYYTNSKGRSVSTYTSGESFSELLEELLDT